MPILKDRLWMGSVVAITEGELDFGPWEQIFYGEFDGQREKRVLAKVIGEQEKKYEINLGGLKDEFRIENSYFGKKSKKGQKYNSCSFRRR